MDYRKGFIAFLLIAFCFNACNYVKNVSLLLGGSTNEETFTYRIPFEYKKGLIVVKARINGSEWKDFIFDTGAFNSKIESVWATSLGLPVKAEKSNSDSKGNVRTLEVVQIGTFQVGEMVFKNIGAGKVVYGEKSASPCISDGGLIGANLIGLANWKIDYDQQELWVSDQPFTPQKSKDLITFDFSHPVFSGTPEINFPLEGKTVSTLLDCGSNGTLDLPKAVAEQFAEIPAITISDQSTAGIYGTKADQLLNKQLCFQDTPISVLFSNRGNGLLGNGFLEHFTVYLDYEKDQIHLIPQSPLETEPELPFIPGRLTDSLWVVNRTSGQLPFQLGDTLLTVNGHKPGELYQDHCDFFMHVRELYEHDSLVCQKLSGEEVVVQF